MIRTVITSIESDQYIMFHTHLLLNNMVSLLKISLPLQTYIYALTAI